MRAGLLLCAALGLAGCVTTPAPVVEVPIPVPCIETMPERPHLFTDAELARMSGYQLALALRTYHLRASGYIAQLEAVASACRK